MSLYDKFHQRQRRIRVVGVVLMLGLVTAAVVSARYPSGLTTGVWYGALLTMFATVGYVNTLMCCPRCRRQVLPWYGHGIPSPPIPRVCRICGLDFVVTQA